MMKQLLGGVLIIYLAGLFGFGLVDMVTHAEPDVAAALAYGARWPGAVLRAFGVI